MAGPQYSSEFSPIDPRRVYSSSERSAVVALSSAGLLTILAVIALALAQIGRPRKQKSSANNVYSHLVAYYVSLLLANALQGVGTAMNVKWVLEHGVTSGGFCAVQGGLKQAGNIGTALWSFMIALHLFNLLFLRWPSTKAGLLASLIGGWSAVVFFVVIGPLALQKVNRGSYFGISGLWCWIRSEYGVERTMLEYFFEYLSVVLGFVLYTAIILRVRGNLHHCDGRWGLRFVPRGDSWKLSFGRDLVDSYMLRLAVRIIWLPVAYSIALLPISISRLSEFSGHSVPLWATIASAMIFNLSGFVNVVLLVAMWRFLPDASALPSITARKEGSMSFPEKHGITPFVLPPSEAVVTRGLRRQGSGSSIASVDSTTPLRRPEAAIVADSVV